MKGGGLLSVTPASVNGSKLAELANHAKTLPTVPIRKFNSSEKSLSIADP
jgi:hypothetical protein